MNKNRGALALLNRGFGKNSANTDKERNHAPVGHDQLPPLPHPPAMETSMVIPLCHIRNYEENPRQHENPEHDSLKESIKKDGLTQTIQVTKRPEDDFYIVRSGANTRLKILNELLNEAIEQNNQKEIQKYSVLSVMYHPYTDELDLLAMHIQENTLRGGMYYIDIASGFYAATEKIKSELKSDKLSFSELVAALEERKLKTTRQNLPLLLFAHEIRNVFPRAYGTGMGRPLTEKIRENVNRLEEWINAKELGELLDDTKNAFFKILSTHDEENMTASKLEAIMEAAFNQLGDEIGEANIANEINNLRDYKSLEAPKCPTQNVSAPLGHEVAPMDEDKSIETEATPDAKNIEAELEPEDFEATPDVENVGAPVGQDEAEARPDVENVGTELESEDFEATLDVENELKQLIEENKILSYCFAINKDGENNKSHLGFTKNIAFDISKVTTLLQEKSEIIVKSNFDEIILAYQFLKRSIGMTYLYSSNPKHSKILFDWFIGNQRKIFESDLTPNTIAEAEFFNDFYDVNDSQKLYEDFFHKRGYGDKDIKSLLVKYKRAMTLLNIVLNQSSTLIN